MDLVSSIFGSKPGLVSGGAGTTVVILIAVMKWHRMCFAVVALAGVAQILVGLFKFGKFIRLVPSPVMYGFVAGLVIFMS